MADITITVPIKSVFREVARRTSIATKTDPFYAQKTTEEKQYSQLQGEGDRITSDFTKEAAKEVLKAYLSRQGDVTGIAYEYDKKIPQSRPSSKQREIVALSGIISGINTLPIVDAAEQPSPTPTPWPVPQLYRVTVEWGEWSIGDILRCVTPSVQGSTPSFEKMPAQAATGSAYITSIAPENKTITFDTDLVTTAANFVAENAAYYLVLGIVLTYVEGGMGVPFEVALVFEAETAGVPFTSPEFVEVPFASPVVGLQQITMNGEVTQTAENVTGVEGLIGTGDIVYRFSENASPLSERQTAAIVERLSNNTRDAIVYYVLVSLYRTDGNQKKEAETLVKALSLIDELSGDLYRLHD